ncbi:trypsin-like serine protease [Streptomyces sp. CB00455]|uniref:trypsin-like serine protease n=1 Tax=Streptomyces sp. CB00455 TaxID=1703927 RepID=UPI000A8065C2|nr:trypsin-like serine protease [Streptomyces sp. CB00455]
MALQKRRLLPIAATVAAAILGTSAAPTAAAVAEPAANAAAPVAVENGAYPGADAVLAATGAKLIRGDGGITHVPCDAPHQIAVWARPITLPLYRICFRAPGATGVLALTVADTFRIQTTGRDLRASLTTDGKNETVDVKRDTVVGVGEGTNEDAKSTLLELRVTGAAATPPGVSVDISGLAFSGKLTIGDAKRSCSATLVDPQWVLSAKSCFADDPTQINEVAAGAPKDKTTVVVGLRDLPLLGGHTSDIVELVPHPDRDLVMARLAKPASNITPALVSSTAPTTGQQLTVAGFGRTKTEWVPASRHEAAFTAGTTTATGFDITAKTPADATVCAGDAGGPAVRQVDVREYVLLGVVSRSWQGGCLGSAETRTGAFVTRVDNLGEWVQQTRALAPGWKTEALVQAGSSLFQGIRLADGSWTGFTDVQTMANSIGGIRTAAAAGIEGATHVLAVSNTGGLFHTVRNANGTWTGFGDVFPMTNSLAGLTQVSAVSIGGDLHVVAVASGKVFHAVRKADGNWTKFGDLAPVAGPIGTVTSVATAATAGGQLQVVPVAGGKAYHTVRNASGQWSIWGDIAGAAGSTDPINSVSMAGIGGDAHIVITTDNGIRQYHGMRNANGTWERFAELKDIFGTITAKSAAATSVNGELQLTVTTTDGKLLHTTRRTDRTWSSTTPVSLQGIAGTLGTLSTTGTL